MRGALRHSAQGFPSDVRRRCSPSPSRSPSPSPSPSRSPSPSPSPSAVLSALALTLSPSERRFLPLSSALRASTIAALDGGRAALSVVRDSPLALARVALPSLPWRPWLLAQLPRSAPADEIVHVHRATVDAVALALGIQRAQDWRAVRVDDLSLLPAARALVQRFNGSLRLLLNAVYPEIPVHVFSESIEAEERALAPCGVRRYGDLAADSALPVALPVAASSSWRARYVHVYAYRPLRWNEDVECAWLDALAAQRGVERYAHVLTRLVHASSSSTSTGGGAALFIASGGRSVLARSGQSPLAAVARLYGPRGLRVDAGWLGVHVARAGLRDDASSERTLLHSVAEALGVVHVDDWYRVSRSQLERLGLDGALSARGGLRALVPRHVSRDTPWHPHLLLGPAPTTAARRSQAHGSAWTGL